MDVYGNVRALKRWDPAVSSGGAGNYVSGERWLMCKLMRNKLSRFYQASDDTLIDDNPLGETANLTGGAGNDVEWRLAA